MTEQINNKNTNPDQFKMRRILWLDLEMTGLSPESNVIIEVGGVVTDSNFKELESYQSVVYQDQKHLDKMDSWNQKCHRKSGLYFLIPKGKSLSIVEEDLLSLLESHFKSDELVVIAGNCIYQDRNFIRRYMPRFDKRLYYRMLDVTAFKLIAQERGHIFKKANKHRVLDDIRESIKELSYYLEKMNFQPAVSSQNKD